jgi:glutathione S-transferase
MSAAPRFIRSALARPRADVDRCVSLELTPLHACAPIPSPQRRYLVGGKFSFADLALAGLVLLSARVGIDLSAFTNVQAWAARCTSRPAFARVMSPQA